MLRVVISIYKGKVKASTVLRKVYSKSRKNKLYFAFRELGRVERTIFLLNYIHDPALRKLIQAATCKEEILSGISPYWREHINRLGVFRLDMNKNSAEIEYNLKGKPEI